MPVVHTQTTTCAENSGLSEATVRVIMSPDTSESRSSYATEVINLISENEFENFAFNILSDPTIWTLATIAQTPFCRRLRHYSRNHFMVSDVTCTHSIKQPNALLLTIELAFQNVSTYSFTGMATLDKTLKVVKNKFPISVIRRSDAILSRSHFQLFVAFCRFHKTSKSYETQCSKR